MIFTKLIATLALALPALTAPAPQATGTASSSSGYWLSTITRQGTVPFGADSTYSIYRNVKDFGAVGDGTTDDTDAINRAISDGSRCGGGDAGECQSSTVHPAIVYFPAGTYLVSKPVIQYYYTQLVGDATAPPTIKASAGFTGMAVIDADPYEDDGTSWWVNQNNFFRQVRNFVIDITAQPISSGACIHWQVAQATSLQNIVFNMATDTSDANKQMGIFMDNGSGGFMSDLTFNGGGYGAFLGSQQFTTRNMTFNGCNTAIFMNWNWAWVLKDITINNCKVGVDMANGVTTQTVGSVLFLDSKISNTPIGVNTSYVTTQIGTNGTLVLDNVDMTTGVTTAIHDAQSNAAIVQGGTVVKGFMQGNSYTGGSPAALQKTAANTTLPASLLNADGTVFTRSKPQYETLPASSFVSVKAGGAKGDGTTDDTVAIQKVLDSATADQVVYFDHGAYIVTDTINVPKNIKITGEIWPMIMAKGTSFNDATNPKPVFRVGQPGDEGAVEMSDLIFQTLGPAPGAIMIEWNLKGSSNGAAAMWDVHNRIGGSAGTELTLSQCAKNPNATHTADPACQGAFMMMHVTESASNLYLENTWFWVADHDLEIGANSQQIDIYNGRGVLIESAGPVWLYGTASEHSQLYNYQLNNASDIYMAMIQTETAYMQGNPDATTPFAANTTYNDPTFANCAADDASCARTWGLRAIGSTNVYVYGAGLYSFFDNYDQTCLEGEACQTNMVSIESSAVHMFGLSTKAAVNMISVDGTSAALDTDNRNNFCATLSFFSSGA